MQSNEERKRLDENVELFCECGRKECLQLLQIPASMYDDVRGNGRLFVARAGHEQPPGQEHATAHSRSDRSEVLYACHLTSNRSRKELAEGRSAETGAWRGEVEHGVRR